MAHLLSALTAFSNPRDALDAYKPDQSLTACWTKGCRLATVTSIFSVVITLRRHSQAIEIQETLSFPFSLDHVRLSYLELFVALYKCNSIQAAANNE